MKIPGVYENHFMCEPKCPHLKEDGETAECLFYEQDLDQFAPGQWFMCQPCEQDTYSPVEEADHT
jgi:hypothetical protein